MAAKEVRKPVDKFDLLNEMGHDLPLFNDKDYETKTEPIPSGSLSLDLAIGIGGFPRGGIVDIYGNESAGKSLISIMAIAQMQKSGGVAVVWDAERSYSKNLAWMRVNGVDTSKLKFLKLKPTQGAEIGFDAIEKILKAKAADLIVIDSAPALIPQSALEKDMTDPVTLAARASLLTSALPRLAALADESGTCIMFINQMRANIGGGMYGPTEKETSIFALKFFSSLRMRVKKVNKSQRIENEVPVAHRVHIDIVKNKVAAPYRQAEFEINYLKGVDTASEVADILIACGVAKQESAWFEYDGKRFHGLAKLVEHFRGDAKSLEKGIEKVRSMKINTFGVQKDPTAVPANPDELTVAEED
jgi:recombination protein RecA